MAKPNPTVPESTDETTTPESPAKPLKQQSRAIQARWAAEHATEESLREHFQTIPLDRGLALLGQMRHNCELAGQILNGRINVPEDQRCETCKKTYDSLVKSGMRDWFLNQPYYDKEDRSIIRVRHFCSSACISHYNNRTQGIRGVADRGMVPSDNPKLHPRQTHPAQTELAKKG